MVELLDVINRLNAYGTACRSLTRQHTTRRRLLFLLELDLSEPGLVVRYYQDAGIAVEQYSAGPSPADVEGEMMETAMRTHVAAGIGTLALTFGMAASGCTGGSDAEAESPVNISQLRADLEERFSETPWYGHITAIKWANGQLEVRTDASPGEGLRPPCGGILRLAFAQGEPGTLDVIVAMFGVRGVGLGGCG